MKEYLFKYNDQYTLIELSKEDAESNPEQYIEIPEKYDAFIELNSGEKVFYKWHTNGHCLVDGSRLNLLEDFVPKVKRILWRRDHNITGLSCMPMRESLNNKIATAEVARQGGEHSHYKKDVSHLNVIDPYRIADLYGLHPCADHIMKKSLCAGNRGHKDTLRDIQDIIDTAERWKQMIEEDNNEI